MPKLLPFEPELPFYSFSTTLDDPNDPATLPETFTFDVRWNERDSAWFFDLYTDAGELICAGQKLLLGVPIGYKYLWDPRHPRGVFILDDTSGENSEATYFDIGVRVDVYYVPLLELV